MAPKLPAMQGYVRIDPETTPISLLHWLWRQIEPAQRLGFLAELGTLLTPTERRVLLSGLDPEDEEEGSCDP